MDDTMTDAEKVALVDLQMALADLAKLPELIDSTPAKAIAALRGTADALEKLVNIGKAKTAAAPAVTCPANCTHLRERDEDYPDGCARHATPGDRECLAHREPAGATRVGGDAFPMGGGAS